MADSNTGDFENDLNYQCGSLEGLNRLLHVTHMLAVEIDLAKMLDTIVIEACRALRCERAILYQLDNKRNVLSAMAGTDQTILLPLDSGIAGYVARQRQRVNIDNPQLDPRWDSRHDRSTGFSTRSVLAVPLVAARDGRLLGVLEFLNNIGGPFDRDDEALAVAFSHHAAAALDRARLVDDIQRRRDLEVSLNVAREVQRRFMPSKLPTIAGYEVATWWYPNEAVGGDYCDVVLLPSGNASVCVADVSGHGLGPSLLMASVRASLRTLLVAVEQPDLLLNGLARAMADDFTFGPFVTMVVATLNTQTHKLSFANAGHAPAVHLSGETGAITPLSSTAPPLGVLDDGIFPLGPEIPMNPGDLVLLGTDGIIESMDYRGEQFGMSRLEQLLRKLAGAPVSEIVRSIGREVELYYVGDSPPDDLTVLALRRTSKPAQSSA